MADERPGHVAFHPLQLTSVAAPRVQGLLRPARDGDPDEPRLDLGSVTGVTLAGRGEGFRCRVRIAVDIPVLEESLFHGSVTMEAHFVDTSGEKLPLAAARAFARRQVTYLVWPFARAYLDQMAMMTGVAVPPLPLLLVPRDEPER